MAALSEADMQIILGANYHAEQEAIRSASGVVNAERMLRGQIAMMDDKKSVSFYFALLGVVLILASIFSVTGQTLIIQCAVGAAICVSGLVGFGYYYSKLRNLRAQATAAVSA
jgi:hypothetical protein